MPRAARGSAAARSGGESSRAAVLPITERVQVSRAMPEPKPRSTESSPADTENVLNERSREILKDIVQTYISSGEPVSSRTVSKHGHLQLSAATIRNVMADLEEMGYLRQPHASAGRVPTESAYRLYIESLMQWHQLPVEERRYIEDEFRSTSGRVEDLMSAATLLLSELSHNVGVVLTPVVEEIVLKSAEFVLLGGRRVLCVLVSATGFIDHIVIETESPLSREELIRISNYMTANFAGSRLQEIRDTLLARMDEERVHVDQGLRHAIAVAGRAVGGSSSPEVLIEGTTSLLEQPELSDVEQVRRVLETFADQARLVAMLNKCLAGEGVRVVLGEDSEITSELDFGLVATPYNVGERPLGSLGIIGPARMEYPRLVPLVHFLGETLSRALECASEE